MTCDIRPCCWSQDVTLGSRAPTLPATPGKVFGRGVSLLAEPGMLQKEMINAVGTTEHSRVKPDCV